MKAYKYISPPSVCEGFSETSAEELRVLVAIMESGEPVGESEIILRAGVSSSRAKSALTFWEAEGVISADISGVITEEFAERAHEGEILEEDAVTVAENIRNESLKDLFDEFAEMTEKPSLNNNEIKCISALVSQYALSDHYLLELAAHIKSTGKLTVAKLRDKAIKLVSKGIDNSEALEQYILDMEDRSAAESEFRRLLGIYNRNISAAERKMFAKWSDEFGYSTVIVGEAYSMSVMGTGKLSLPYMDKILTSWHFAGCKTVEECRALSNSAKAKVTEKEKSELTRKKPRSEAPKPRYGDFDADDALNKALERSYNFENK